MRERYAQSALERAKQSLWSGLEPTEEPEEGPEDDWHDWLRWHFSSYLKHEFAPEQEQFWNHVWSIRPGQRPHPFIALWPRGWGKSTSLEMAACALGVRGVKTYCLYLCGTQEQADDHVQNIADMLLSLGVQRDIGPYGTSKGWRRNRLRAAGGFTVDAIGLDTAARGRKLEEIRPDLLIGDDLDDSEDSENVTEKKIRNLTRKILPAGSDDLAILFGQNLVHPDSIFARLGDGRARFLADRIVSGPVPAIRNLRYEERAGRLILLDGEASWTGLDFEQCQAIADDEGPDAFLIERQNRIDVFGHPAFLREWWEGDRNRYDPTDRRLKNTVYARFAAFDTANKDEPEHAYTVCVVGEITRDYRLLIRDVIRGRPTFPDLPDFAINALKKHAADLKYHGGWIEDAASGTQLLQVLWRSGPQWIRERDGDVILWAAGTKGRKEERWGAAAVHCRRDCVLLPYNHETVSWLPEFEEELFALRPKYKDQRDAFSLLINELEMSLGILSQGWVNRRMIQKNRMAS